MFGFLLFIFKQKKKEIRWTTASCRCLCRDTWVLPTAGQQTLPNTTTWLTYWRLSLELIINTQYNHVHTANMLAYQPDALPFLSRSCLKHHSWRLDLPIVIKYWHCNSFLCSANENGSFLACNRSREEHRGNAERPLLCGFVCLINNPDLLHRTVFSINPGSHRIFPPNIFSKVN